MKLGQKAPKKSLFTEQDEINLFLNLFGDCDSDEEFYRGVAKAIYIDGMTKKEAGDLIGYSERQMDRLSVKVIKIALKRAIRKIVRKGVDAECPINT